MPINQMFERSLKSFMKFTEFYILLKENVHKNRHRKDDEMRIRKRGVRNLLH